MNINTPITNIVVLMLTSTLVDAVAAEVEVSAATVTNPEYIFMYPNKSSVYFGASGGLGVDGGNACVIWKTDEYISSFSFSMSHDSDTLKKFKPTYTIDVGNNLDCTNLLSESLMSAYTNYNFPSRTGISISPNKNGEGDLPEFIFTILDSNDYTIEMSKSGVTANGRPITLGNTKIEELGGANSIRLVFYGRDTFSINSLTNMSIKFD